jgi:hypothetical protein
MSEAVRLEQPRCSDSCATASKTLQSSRRNQGIRAFA